MVGGGFFGEKGVFEWGLGEVLRRSDLSWFFKGRFSWSFF